MSLPAVCVTATPHSTFCVYLIWYTQSVSTKRKLTAGASAPSERVETQGKRIPAIFYRTESGGEPVREWLKGLPLPEDRKRIGEDIKTVEFGWPIGMPVCKALGDGIYEGTDKVEAKPCRTSALLRGQKKQNGSSPWIHQKNAKDSHRGLRVSTNQ